MSTRPEAPFRLSDTERLDRYRLLREATARRPPLTITEDGFRLLLESATSPQLREAVDEQVRPDLDRLIQVGLIGGDGRLSPGAGDLVEAARRPDIQMQIEVAAGQSVRIWKAWLGFRHAVIMAQPSPAITAADTPRDVAGRQPPRIAGYDLQAVMPGWVPVAAARWLRLGPRESPGGHGHVPWPDLARRLADPDLPPPAGDPVLARIWAQPLQVGAITVEPGGGRMLVLDAGRAGLWRLAPETDAEAEEATLTPLPSHAAWQLLLTLITRADRAPRQAPFQASRHAAI